MDISSEASPAANLSACQSHTVSLSLYLSISVTLGALIQQKKKIKSNQIKRPHLVVKSPTLVTRLIKHVQE